MGVRVSPVKPSNCFRHLEKSVIFHFSRKSFILHDVKLAELSNNSYQNTLTPPTYFQGVRTPNPHDLCTGRMLILGDSCAILYCCIELAPGGEPCKLQNSSSHVVAQTSYRRNLQTSSYDVPSTSQRRHSDVIADTV